MDTEFYKTAIKFINESGCVTNDTEVSCVHSEEIPCDTRQYQHSISNFNKKFDKTSNIVVCLLSFTILDDYVENLFSLYDISNFKQKYSAISKKADSSIEKIIGESYRLIRYIRNCMVHNLSGIKSHDKTIYFVNKKDTSNILKIDWEHLRLLFRIIILIVQGHYCIKTSGHYEAALVKYYMDINNYLQTSGEFIDEIDIPLIEINYSFTIKTGKRYIVVNQKYSIDKHNSRISLIDPYEEFSGISGGIDYSEYGTDYHVAIDGIDYIIPREIMSDDYSININELDKWKSKFANASAE